MFKSPKTALNILLLLLLAACSNSKNSFDVETTKSSSSALGDTYYALNLGQGESLKIGALHLTMQSDGNLVLYKGSTPLWYTGTAGQDCSAKKCVALFQADGNFVVYNDKKAIWDSVTAGNSGAKLILSESLPYLKIQNSDGTIPWESQVRFNTLNLTPGQSIQAEFSRLTFQSDGNLVLYKNKDGSVLWSARTAVRACTGSCVATMKNGNIVLTQNGTEYWSTKSTVNSDNHIVLSRRPPYLSLRSSAGKMFWSAGQNLNWLTPLEPLNGFNGAPDFMELFKNPEKWNNARSKVNVFKIYSWYIDNGPEADLKFIFQFLKRHDIALAVEYGAVTPPTDRQCGAVEGYVGYGGSAPDTLAGRIKALGGDLAYISLDEPINGAHYPYKFGPPPAVGCESPIVEIAANVARSYLIIQSYFPSVQFGDIENAVAFPEGANWIEDYGQFIDWFKIGTGGSPLAFFHDDALFASGEWQKKANALMSLLASKDVPYGMIHNGVGTETVQEWMTAAKARIQTYKTLNYPEPDQHNFQTWSQGMPAMNLPDSDPMTLTALVNYYFSDYAKAPAPIVLERVYNSKVGSWLYSTSDKELKALGKDWVERQHASYLYPTAAGDTNLVPMYRMVSALGDHLYTCDASEFSSALRIGYVSEGVIGYAYASNDNRGTPFFNIVTPRGLHFYSTSKAELTKIQTTWGGVEEPTRCRMVPFIINGWKW